MASATGQAPHLSLAPPHSPSTIAATLLISLISVLCVVPFVALSSSDLIPRTLIPTAAYSLCDSLLAVATSFPFYFFLLNLLIVALICLSGVFDPASKRRDQSDDLQDAGDLRRRDYFSAAHNAIQETLALNQFYETQAPAASPSYLRFVKSSSVCVVDEAQGSEQAHGNIYESEDDLRKNITNLLEDPASSRDDNVTFSAGDTHLNSALRGPTESRSMIKHRSVLVSSVSPVSKEGHIANLHHEVIFPGADNIIGTKDHVQVCDDDGLLDQYGRDVHEKTEDCATHRERINSNTYEYSDGNVDTGSDVMICSAHDDDDDDDGSGKLGFQEPDAGVCMQGETSQAQLQKNQAEQKQQQPWMGAEVQEQDQNVGDNMEKWSLKEDGICTAMAAVRDQELDANNIAADHQITLFKAAAAAAGKEVEGLNIIMPLQVDEGELQQQQQLILMQEEHRESEEQMVMMMMSREELNERASAFISAFRRKLISTANIVDID